MIDEVQHVIMIAGPKGAGKSTAAPVLLRDYLGITQFVNADVIAQGLSGFEPERAALQAGRIMLARLNELASARRSFAFETTLAARSFVPWVGRLREQGYQFHLLYLWVPTPETSIRRVARRVQLGGHHVPDEVIRRRHSSSLSNFFTLYRDIADYWRVHDNSQAGAQRTVAEGSGRSGTQTITEPETWQSIKSLADAEGGRNP